MDNLISRKQSQRFPQLFVKKYTRRVFYDNLWHKDRSLLEARGHVEDADGNVVIRPLTKIFNRFENGTDIDLDETCVYVRKVNGFMAAATYVPLVDQVVVSTTGSLDSDFVGIAEKYITDDVKNMIKMCGPMFTCVFEICDPSDPHIVPEEVGAYLLAIREVDQQSDYFSTEVDERLIDVFSKMLKVKRPEWGVAKFSDIVAMTDACKHEGYVVYGQESNTALKIKSKYYLALKAAARARDIAKLDKTRVDEEFYDLIDYLKSIRDQFTAADEQTRLEIIREYIEAGSAMAAS